jgi:hypothetical protein
VEGITFYYKDPSKNGEIPTKEAIDVLACVP